MKRKLVSALIAAAMVMGSFSCVQAEEAETEAVTEAVAEETEAVTEAAEKTEAAELNLEGSYTIGYAPATLNNAFWLAVKDGVQQAIDETGVDVELVDIDANGDQSIMNDGISNLLSSGIDALLCAPADSNAVGSALEECQNAGVPVINFDTPVPEDQKDMVVTVIASDNYNAGYVVGQDAASKMRLPRWKTVPRFSSFTRPEPAPV